MKVGVKGLEYTPENVAKLDKLADILGVEREEVSERIYFLAYRRNVRIAIIRAKDAIVRAENQAEIDRIDAEAERLRQKANATLAEIKSNLQKESEKDKKDVNKK